MRYNKVLLVRITKEDFKLLKNKAKRMGLSISGYIRMIIRGFA